MRLCHEKKQFPCSWRCPWLVSVFAGLGITAYAADAQTLWVDPVNGSDSAAGTQVAPFQTIEKAKAAAAALSAGGDVTVQEVVSSASIR